ncbi:hypothetical protein F5Y13DRAFT_192017 [Hypoxylon sp. FL1857]|nr:hypothetical protein F5Y13DRAFT_192017 [Hypoxylon sp. FL1857]
MPLRNWIRAKVSPTIDLTRKIAHPRAQGCVSTDNYFLCECGSVCKNMPHNISTHLCKLHKVDSAYQMNQFKGRQWDCKDCKTRHANFNAFLAHYRRDHHGFRGDSSGLREGQDPNRPASTLKREFQLWLQRALL